MLKSKSKSPPRGLNGRIKTFQTHDSGQNGRLKTFQTLDSGQNGRLKTFQSPFLSRFATEILFNRLVQVELGVETLF
jgi:hypothetical protein